MIIKFHTDYDAITHERIKEPVWPVGWPIPRVGDLVSRADGLSLKVIAVDWFPDGNDGDEEPFVYIVLHQ